MLYCKGARGENYSAILLQRPMCTIVQMYKRKKYVLSSLLENKVFKPFCPAGIFGAHCVKKFRTFVAAVAKPCCLCHVWANCGYCQCVVVCMTLGDENSAQLLWLLPLLFVLCLCHTAHVCASKALYKNLDLPYKVMAHFDKFSHPNHGRENRAR